MDYQRGKNASVARGKSASAKSSAVLKNAPAKPPSAVLKNAPAKPPFGIKASSSNSNSNSLDSVSAKSTVKVALMKKPKEIVGESHSEESRLDSMDCTFNAYINATAMKLLMGKSSSKITPDVDKQIASLQKRINDNLGALEEARTKLSTSYLLQEQKNLLNHYSVACKLCSNDPCFTGDKSFSELMLEIDCIKNQLPCKSVYVPTTDADLTNFQATTTQLLRSLEQISTLYGADQTSIMQTASELEKINLSKLALQSSKHEVDSVANQAGMNLINNAVLKETSSNFSNTKCNKK